MTISINWGYVAKRWVIAMAIIAILFLLFVVAVRLFSGSGGTPVEGGEKGIIEGKPKQPSLNDTQNQPQNNVGGLEEYRRFESNN